MRSYDRLIGSNMLNPQDDSPPAEDETGGESPLRAVVADDSALLREGLVSLLETAGFSVVGQAADGDDLLLKVRSYEPDVAIVDIRMPPTHTDEGLRAARTIRERWPEIGILVLSQHVHVGYALELLATGTDGVGYLLKERVTDLNELAESVRRVAARGSV